MVEFFLELNLFWFLEYEIGKDIKVDFIDIMLVGDDKRCEELVSILKM